MFIYFRMLWATSLLDVWGRSPESFYTPPMYERRTGGGDPAATRRSLHSEAFHLGRGEKSGDLHTLYTPTQFANLHFNFPKTSRYFKYPIPNFKTQS